MQFLLDANAVITLLNNTDAGLSKRLRQHKTSDIGIPSIVIHELYYGAFKSQRAVNNVELIDQLQFEILDFTRDDARSAGEIRALLANKGTPIGPLDVLIAGQAKARQLTLITRNTNEFRRVAGLQIENWMSSTKAK